MPLAICSSLDTSKLALIPFMIRDDLITDARLQGALTNSPVRLSHYMGIWRGFLAAGEAVCFGLDSIKIPYRTFASGIFAFYLIGIIICIFLVYKHVEATCYFKEGEHGAVVPNYILEKMESKEYADSQLDT